MRDAAGNSLGYVYVTAGGALGFHNDTAATNTVERNDRRRGLARPRAAPGHQRPVGHRRGMAGRRPRRRSERCGRHRSRHRAGGPVPDRRCADGAHLRRRLRRRRVRVGTPRPGRGQRQRRRYRADSARSRPRRSRSTSTGRPRPTTSPSPATTCCRDGAVIGSVDASTTAFTDGSTLPSTAYTYAVQARDGSNNVSAPSAGVPVTTPAAATPVFADGFESGNLSAWTSSAGPDGREHRCPNRHVRSRGQHHQRQHARPQDLDQPGTPMGTHGSASRSRARPAKSTSCACATRPGTPSATST